MKLIASRLVAGVSSKLGSTLSSLEDSEEGLLVEGAPDTACLIDGFMTGMMTCTWTSFRGLEDLVMTSSSCSSKSWSESATMVVVLLRVTVDDVCCGSSFSAPRSGAAANADECQ